MYETLAEQIVADILSINGHRDPKDQLQFRRMVKVVQANLDDYTIAVQREAESAARRMYRVPLWERLLARVASKVM